MRITELKLKNFRNYEDLELHPDPGVNLFFGRNGSGKTNLLEAVHYAALGRSHRISSDANVVRYGEDAALSTVGIETALGQREITVRFHPGEAQKKEILIDGKNIRRFSDMMGCLRCVIFSPEDLGLIREGPSVRRRYLDMMISQISRKYFIALQQYRTGLDQRNAILRNLQLRIAYHSSVKEEDNLPESFCRLLQENREDDIRLGMTSVGPHRDDLILTLDRNPMKQFSSQGQVRTAALSMKLSQMKILKDDSGEEPVLLLDDVMSELDRKRRASLISEILSFQTFITCADREDVDCEKVSRMWQVSAENGSASLLPVTP